MIVQILLCTRGIAAAILGLLNTIEKIKMSSSDSSGIPMGKLIPKKLEKKNYVSSKYGKISEKSSSEDSDDGGSNDKVNEGASTSKVNEGASSSINTFGEKDGLVFTNSDFNVTCKDIGFKKQTKFDVENNNYQIKFEPKQGKSQKLIICFRGNNC